MNQLLLTSKALLRKTRHARRASAPTGWHDELFSGAHANGGALTLVLLTVSSVAIFFKDYFITVFGAHTEILGIAILLACAVQTILRGQRNGQIEARVLYSCVVLALAWVGSLTVNSTLNSSSYYAAFFVAMAIVVIKPKKFLGMMTVLMSINTALQLYEAISGSFLFAYVDDEFEYDEKMLSTNDGALRVKGFFASPLNAIGIEMSLALMRPRSNYSWILLCVSSTLGQGRLGLIVGLIGLFVNVLTNRPKASAMNGKLSILLPIVSIIGVVALTLAFGTEESIKRMLEAGSADNSQNVSRLLYWGQSLIEISNLTPAAHLFGKFGYIKALQGGTESDWLRIWLDNGLLCLFVYFVPLVYGLVSSVRTRLWPEAYSFAATLFIMAVYPHAQSLPNGILVWLLILTRYQLPNRLRRTTLPQRRST